MYKGRVLRALSENRFVYTPSPAGKPSVLSVSFILSVGTFRQSIIPAMGLRDTFIVLVMYDYSTLPHTTGYMVS